MLPDMGGVGMLRDNAQNVGGIVRYSVIVAAAVVLGVGGCTGLDDSATSGVPDQSTTTTQGTTTTISETVLQRQAWEANPALDYEIAYYFTNQNGMGGAPSDGALSMTVSRGTVVACEWDPNWETNTADECEGFLAGWRSPIDDLFAWVARLPREHTTVTYHEQWHFPTDIVHDVPVTADEEYVAAITHFIDTSG